MFSFCHGMQVITSIEELVEMCSAQIQSGWRPLFSALRTVHGNKTDMKDYLIGEYSMGLYTFNFKDIADVNSNMLIVMVQ